MIPNPFLFPEGFANLGDKNPIPDAPGAPGVANLDTGFPFECGEDEALGGIPPDRKDMNGILFYGTDNSRFLAQGGAYQFDATYAGVIGGYPVGAILALPDGDGFVQSTIAANIHDPAVPANLAAYWRPWGGQLSGATQFARDIGAANAVVIAIVTGGGGAAYVDGQPVRFQAAHTSTSACTLDAGAGPKALVRNDGIALIAGDLIALSMYQAFYSHTDDKFFLLQAVPSQVGAHMASFTHAGVAFTTAAGPVNAGLASAGNFVYTPQKSGNLVISIKGTGANSVAGDGVLYEAVYGAGATGPAGGGGPSGTIIGTQGSLTSSSANATGEVSSIGTIPGLTVGSPYWFDFQLAAITGGNATIQDVTLTIIEV